MMAMGLCVAFSGPTGFGLSLALVEGGASGSGLAPLALGAVGLGGVVSRHLRNV
jgi:hypothetical protein